MKTHALIAGITIAVLNGLILVPDLRPYAAYFLAGAITLALWLIARSLIYREDTKPAPAAAPSAPAAPPPPPPKQAEAEVIAVLSTFQEKGRLIDFLMDDITAYSDAQVGAAARVVHQGGKAALLEHFTVVPVSAESEGSRITISPDAPRSHYRLTGKLAGDGPFTGTLVHKGWKVESVKLPRLLDSDDAVLPPLAPAQVEVQ